MPVFALAETALDRVYLAQPPFIGVGYQSQQFVAFRRTEGESPHFGLSGPQVGNVLDNGTEIVPFDTVSGALVRVEKQVEQGTVEKAPAAVERLGSKDRLGA